MLFTTIPKIIVTKALFYIMFPLAPTAKQRLLRDNRAALYRFGNILGPYNTNVYSGAYDFDILHGGHTTALTLNDMVDGVLIDELETLFDRILSYVRLDQNLGPNDFMQMVIVSDASELNIWTPLMVHTQLTGSEFLQRIAHALSSYQQLILAGAYVTVKYVRALTIRGGGVGNTASEFTRRKRCIIVCHSNMCVWEALQLGIAEHTDPVQFQMLVKRGARRNLDGAKQLRDRCKLGDDVCKQQLPKIESVLGVCIVLVDFNGMRIVYGDAKRSGNLICLLLSDSDNTSHVDYVKKDKIGSLWEKARFCKQCMKGYANESHKCIIKCMACKTSRCNGVSASCWDEFKLHCDACNCKYFDEQCMRNHTKKQCQTYTRCVQCAYLYPRKDRHECNKRVCHNCNQLVLLSQNHQCYHQVLKSDDLPKPTTKYIFYDYETYLNTAHEHVTAGIVAWDINDVVHKQFFTTGEFVDWLLLKEHKGYTCVAHNSGRYDFHFIKRELLARSIVTSDVSNGNTIFYSKIEKHKMRFIDSYKLIPIGLRGFPKAFGLKEMSKGYFPYRFLNDDTRMYVGPMPAVEWFDFDKLRDSERVDALRWYDSVKHTEIRLMDMCWDYCVSDVILLKEGCMKFRDLFLQITDNEIDPLQYITIASVCMSLFRRFHLTTDTIGIVEGDQHDKRYQEALFKDYITKHNLDLVLLDCVDNGCPKCTHPFRRHPKTGIFMKDLYYNARQAHQQQRVVWSHQLDTYPGLQDHAANVFQFEETSVDMREAFSGGHTEPYALYRKCTGDEQIRYVDFTSLYPSVQFGDVHGLTDDTYHIHEELFFPCGHPVEITEVTPDTLHNYFGFVKCDITCPPDLHIPVLPEKKDGKLMFDLTDKIGGQWTVMEVLFAMSLGYRVTKIYSVLHFPDKRSDLFKAYVKQFLKIKTEAAGWNSLGCTTPDEQAVFVETYYKAMGIQLDPGSIRPQKNDGLYLIAKLCLNSLWGKYAQRLFATNTMDVFTWTDMQKVLDRDDVIIKGVILHGSTARTLTLETVDRYLSAPAYTNIAVAAFTTAHARQRLHKSLHILQPEQIIYVDTDSIIYVDSPRYPVKLKLGPNLGDLTDELDTGDYIEEFVSTGPKSYAYRTHKGKICVKVKGVCLSHATSQIINMDTLVEMVKDPSKVVVSQPLQFIINKHHAIHTKQWGPNDGKKLRLTMDKRKIDWEGMTDTQVMTVPKRNKPNQG